MPHIPVPASYQILGLFVLLIASITFVCIKLKIHQFSFKGLFRGIDRKDILLMSLITIPYIALSFVHYGDRFKQGHWFGDIESKTLVITLQKPVELKQINFYLGLSSGSIGISIATNQGESQQLANLDMSESLPIVFRWINVNLHSDKKINKIFFKIEKPVVEIKQLAIIDVNGKYINNYVVNSTPYDNRDDLIGLTQKNKPEHFEMSSIWQSMAVWDEVFYATTAFQFLYHLPAFNSSHPYLGTLLISLGILLFGMNPFGWRFIPLLSGILLVPLIYISAKRMFKHRSSAIFASLLLSCDFMHFVISRVATIDSTVTFFIFIEYMFLFAYLKSNLSGDSWNKSFSYLLGVGICLGVSTAIKWSAIFSVLAILILLIYCELKKTTFRHFELFNKIRLLFVILVIIPITIYCLTYFPAYIPFSSITSNFFNFVIDLQKAMLNYHLKAALAQTNSFVSSWWSWPLIIKPYAIFTYINEIKKTAVVVLLMGNPAIWWFGVFSILILLIEQISHFNRKKERDRDFVIVFILLAIFCQYLPYAIFKRGSFIYYYYTITPFLFLAISSILNKLWMNKKLRIFIYCYFSLVAILFVMFFPVLAGIEVPRSYIFKFLLWYKTWTLF